MSIDREALDRAVGKVLFDVSNYPDSAGPCLLGRDIGPLRAKVVNAVLANEVADDAPAWPAPVNPHDAEEALRPYLGVIYEIDRTVERHSLYVPPEAVLMDLRDQATALRSALDKALEILGIRS